MASDEKKFLIRLNFKSLFKSLRDAEDFDVTLSCDGGQTSKAHKMVLSACSPFFKALLEVNPAKHPIIILNDVPFQHLTAILDFMYTGEITVAQDQLQGFLDTAAKLQVEELAWPDSPLTVNQK